MSEYDTRRFLVGWKDKEQEYATMVYLSQVPTTHKGYSIDAFTGTSELFVMSPEGGVIGNARAYEV